MSIFKMVVIGIFSVSIVAALILFALSKTTSQGQSYNLAIWGTVSSDAFNAAYKNSSLKANKLVTITYFQKDPATFDSQFVEALAEGRGPDMVVLRDDYIYKQQKKLFVIPYKNYTERLFRDTFIEEGELFLSKDGVVAAPFVVDPLVMYWNRDIFSANQISTPPRYWDEIYPLVEKITKKDTAGNILQSTVAFGESRNVTNSKEIISMLLLQAGTPITERRTTPPGLASVLNFQFNYPVTPSESAISFYTQFSNPTSPSYSWNRSLPSSLNMFLSGKLAMYIGFASEIFSIQQKNSNLNFDVTSVPQVRNSPKQIVFGHMYALSIVKQSKQIAGAFIALSALTEATSLREMETVTNLPPVRRDMLVNKPTDAFRSVFYNAALISHTWIDPDGPASANTFRDMIESITSGRLRQSEALRRANDELTAQI